MARVAWPSRRPRTPTCIWTPAGNADPLFLTCLLIVGAHMGGEPDMAAALDMVTSAPRGSSAWAPTGSRSGPAPTWSSSTPRRSGGGRRHPGTRVRRQARAGDLGDGPFRRETFRFDLPGGPLIVRTGWLALRRLTRAPTFPMLAHRDGKRVIIVIHPALPPPAADLARDAVQCRTVLAPLVETYVRRFPDQCRYLAFPPWPTRSTEASAAPMTATEVAP